MLNEVLKQIEQRQRFILTSHARPDGDAVGSTLACCQILRAMGKKADVILHDGVPRIYQPLPFANTVVKADRVNGNYDAAIILECDSIQRTRLQGLEQQFLINIDHHLNGRQFAHINWIDPKAVATAEMVYRLACEAGVTISPMIATCLYTAVLTDTGSFMFQGTNEHTFALARELVLAGADPAHCARNVYFGHSVAKMRLLGDALSIQDVEVAAFFRELSDGRFRVSMRSKGELNVAAVAERFGGGGHECASGCSVDGPLSNAVARVLGQLRIGPSAE